MIYVSDIPHLRKYEQWRARRRWQLKHGGLPSMFTAMAKKLGVLHIFTESKVDKAKLRLQRIVIESVEAKRKKCQIVSHAEAADCAFLRYFFKNFPALSQDAECVALHRQYQNLRTKNGSEWGDPKSRLQRIVRESVRAGRKKSHNVPGETADCQFMVNIQSGKYHHVAFTDQESSALIQKYCKLKFCRGVQIGDPKSRLQRIVRESVRAGRRKSTGVPGEEPDYCFIKDFGVKFHKSFAKDTECRQLLEKYKQLRTIDGCWVGDPVSRLQRIVRESVRAGRKKSQQVSKERADYVFMLGFPKQHASLLQKCDGDFKLYQALKRKVRKDRKYP